MILEIRFDGIIRHPSGWEETGNVISECIRAISPKEIINGFYDGESTAVFYLIEPQAKHPSAYLHVSANEMSGYGALIWYTDGQPPRQGGIYEYAWISDNPAPSDVDHRLMSDSYLPTYHDPASAVPLPQIRTAIEEFCRSETGERPESINWVTGEIIGHRSDKPIPEEPVYDYSDESRWLNIDGSPWIIE